MATTATTAAIPSLAQLSAEMIVAITAVHGIDAVEAELLAPVRRLLPAWASFIARRAHRLGQLGDGRGWLGPELTELHLRRASADDLTAIATHCTGLEVLELPLCAAMDADPLADAIHSLTHICRLSLRGAATPIDTGVAAALTRLLHLTDLDVADADVTCGALRSLALTGVAARLERLWLDGADDSSHDEDIPTSDNEGDPVTPLIQAIAAATGLRLLSLRGCRWLETLPQLPATLESLNVSGCQSLQWKSGGHLPRSLTSLRAAETPLTDTTLNTLLVDSGRATLPLRELDLSWVEDVTIDGLASLLAHCPHLYSLRLRHACAGAVGDRVIRALLTAGATDLAHLVLTHCDGYSALTGQGLSDDGIRLLADHCSKLETLDLSWSVGVTDSAARALVSQLPQLSSLVLQGCKGLTASWMNELPTLSLPALQCVDLSWVNDASPELEARLREAMPRVHVIGYYGADLDDDTSRASPDDDDEVGNAGHLQNVLA